MEEFPQIAAQVGHASAVRRVEDGESAPVRAPVAVDLPAAPVPEPIADQQPALDGMIGVAVPRAAGDPAPFGFMRSLAEDGHIRPLTAVEEEMIRLAIDHYNGRMAEVARRLGIGRSTLYRKLKEYGLAGAEDEASVAAE